MHTAPQTNDLLADELFETVKYQFERNGIMRNVRCYLQNHLIEMMRGKRSEDVSLSGVHVQEKSCTCGSVDNTGVTQSDIRIILLNQLIMEYFHWYGYKYTAQTFAMETGTKNLPPLRESLEAMMGEFKYRELPIMLEIVAKMVDNQRSLLRSVQEIKKYNCTESQGQQNKCELCKSYKINNKLTDDKDKLQKSNIASTINDKHTVGIKQTDLNTVKDSTDQKHSDIEQKTGVLSYLLNQYRNLMEEQYEENSSEPYFINETDGLETSSHNERDTSNCYDIQTIPSLEAMQIKNENNPFTSSGGTKFKINDGLQSNNFEGDRSYDENFYNTDEPNSEETNDDDVKNLNTLTKMRFHDTKEIYEKRVGLLQEQLQHAMMYGKHEKDKDSENYENSGVNKIGMKSAPRYKNQNDGYEDIDTDYIHGELLQSDEEEYEYELFAEEEVKLDEDCGEEENEDENYGEDENEDEDDDEDDDDDENEDEDDDEDDDEDEDEDDDENKVVEVGKPDEERSR